MALARLKGAEADSSHRRRLHLIVVVTDHEQAPPSAYDFPVIIRSSKITDDPDEFLSELGNRLKNIAVETGMGRLAEPRRLFEAREYRASVISAMTLLESKLRERLNKTPWPQTQRPLSLRSLVDVAIEQQALPFEARERIYSWMHIRNEVVHSSMPVAKVQAREIVEGVMELIAHWN
jgi:hypothetical protein